MTLPRLLSLLTLAVLVALPGCGSSAPANAPPVIDSLDLDSTAKLTNGNYVAKGTLKVHDTDDKVTKVNINSAGLAPTSIAVPAGGSVNATLTLEVAVPMAAQFKSGVKVDFDFTVEDSGGAESAKVTKTVTLQD